MEGMVFTLLVGMLLMFCPLHTTTTPRHGSTTTTDATNYITTQRVSIDLGYGFSLAVPRSSLDAADGLDSEPGYCQAAVGRANNYLCNYECVCDPEGRHCRSSACRMTDASESVLLVAGMLAIVFFGFGTLAACHLAMRRTPRHWPAALLHHHHAASLEEDEKELPL